MDIEISVTITAPDGTAHTDRIAAFSKGIEAAGDIGLAYAALHRHIRQSGLERHRLPGRFSYRASHAMD